MWISFKPLIVLDLRKHHIPNMLRQNIELPIELAKHVCQVPIGNWTIWMYFALLAWDCWPTILVPDLLWRHRMMTYVPPNMPPTWDYLQGNATIVPRGELE